MSTKRHAIATAEANQATQFSERMARIETTISTERRRLATKADVADLKATIEKQSRQFLLWLIGAGIALAAVVVPPLLHIINKLLARA